MSEYERGFRDGKAAALKELKEARRGPSIPQIPGLNRDAWKAWLEYRRKLGKRPYKTDTVAKWLAQFPQWDQMAIVRQSISKEWHGLFELKTGKPSQVHPTTELDLL